ncbi:hypothetical protein L7F22_046561 [Adiantum nelumboides]|nr:hypothetical protein [Adiantum nelumboides]
MAALAQELLKREQEKLGKLVFKKRFPRDVIERLLASSNSTSASAPTESGQRLDPSNLNYIMKTGVGTPTKEFYLMLDTGSDLTWTQCTPCISCYPQASPLFDPTKSSSYSPIPCYATRPCEYNKSYGDESFTSGVLAMETFMIGKASLQNFIFGCAQSSKGTDGNSDKADGILGLDWSSLSLIGQNDSFFEGAFAYCLPSILSSTIATGFIEFGANAITARRVGSSFTPMIKISGYYRVWLKAISIGGLPLSLASTPTLAPSPTSISGAIVDSGTVISLAYLLTIMLFFVMLS